MVELKNKIGRGALDTLQNNKKRMRKKDGGLKSENHITSQKWYYSQIGRESFVLSCLFTSADMQYQTIVYSNIRYLFTFLEKLWLA